MKSTTIRNTQQLLKLNSMMASLLSCYASQPIKISGLLDYLHKHLRVNIIIPAVTFGLVYFLVDPCLYHKITSFPQTDDSLLLYQTSPRSSLLVPYSLNHDTLLKIRSINVRKWQQLHQYEQEYSEMGVDRRNNLSLEEFFDIYDGKWPVLLTDVVDKWPAYNWTGDFLNQHYGQEQVVMKAIDYHLDAAISRVFSDAYQISGDPLDQDGLTNAISLAVPLYRFYQNTENAHPKSWTYVEDELFIPMRPELRKGIGNTEYLQEDFFQLFPEDLRPWNAMLLWGTKYSRSSLHMDPYNWTGTNAVIQGHKWWKLYPPGQDEYLYIMKDRRSGFPLNCYKYNSVVDAFDPDLTKYPRFKKAVSIVFEQLPGEILFIPSGWFHQAYNSEETLAISSQVMNRNNYRVVLEEILKVGDIQRDSLPSDIDLMSPEQQVAMHDIAKLSVHQI
ncbi:hypothetical protein LSH36_881g00016 [Paralvinella palmiformis]|uniref:JmjC domain-containing protein n=1 Tax=Paralvinella palmiformis TaxID=53620 RepID=A0AAD9IYR9_9ANNE|nr:hypothetical protein LSH36_881g00016 [Paralvinella palmiformis]